MGRRRQERHGASEVAPQSRGDRGAEHAAVMLYEQTAWSMCFVAQLDPPPTHIRRAKEELLAFLMRVPHRDIPWAAWIRSAEALLRAGGFLFAWVAQEEWGPVHRWLRGEVAEARPLAAMNMRSMR